MSINKILLFLFLSSTAYSQTTTTTNLTPKVFTTINGWSGTNLSSTHGNETIAGVSGKSIENTISLTNVGLSKAQINEGFTSTQGVDVWFWSGNPNQNVTMTQIITDSNGGLTTQNKIIPYTSTYFNNYTNIAVVDKNILNNYSITSKFSFYESTNSPYHYSADLKNPTLSITYVTNPTPPVVIAPIITPVVQEIKFIEPVVTPIVTPVITPVVEIIESPVVVQQTVEEKKIIEQVIEPPKEVIKEAPKEVVKEVVKESPKEETKETTKETPKEVAKEETKETPKETKTSVTEEKQTVTSTQQEVKTKLTDNKIGTEIKIAEVKVKSVQEIKIDALKVNQPSLTVYESKPFYVQRQMAGVPNPDFFMQFNIEQQAVYINVNLNNYINKDPLVARQKILKEIEDEQNELIIQLEQLRRVKG
jgi:hypothetical protein